MTNENKILEMIQDKGLLTNNYLKENNIPKSAVKRLLAKEKIVKVKKGLYNTSDNLTDEYFTAIYGSKEAIFSYFTALYFWDLCEMVPMIYDITVKKNYGGILQKNSKIKLHYVDEKIFDLGKTYIKSPQGQVVCCYDIERCLCDLIKSQDNLYFDYIKYAFNEYYKVQKHDTFKLLKYARELGIEEKVSKFVRFFL